MCEKWPISTYNEDNAASEAGVLSFGQKSALRDARVAVEDLQA
jgi:hypothetical protein